MSDRLEALSNAGVAIWLDDISRERLTSGNLASLRDTQRVVGVTSNPTIFANAVSKGDSYSEALHDLALRNVPVDGAAQAITTADVRAGCDVMRPVYDATGGVDGRVSIEVDPRLAGNTEATIAEAKALWWLVDRPNLFIKIPATKPGLPAITAALAAGISVNVTLIFSLDRYDQVMDAFLDGMEQAAANGHDISHIASVASFFVSRVDTEVDKRLEAIGSQPALALRGTAAVANARLAYQRYEKTFASERWQRLAGIGGRPQRPLWASTGVKNPAYPDTLYVTELVAPGTVNTMPEATLDAFADHGELGWFASSKHGDSDTIARSYVEAQGVLDSLAEVGVDYNDVVAVLEDEGVSKFEKSWQELLGTLEQHLNE